RVGVPPIPEARPEPLVELSGPTPLDDSGTDSGPTAPGPGAAAKPPDRPTAPAATLQAAAHAAAGKSAEAGGDLERAEQAYWRAASIEGEPALRANYLVAHARVLLARGDVETARGQLES